MLPISGASHLTIPNELGKLFGQRNVDLADFLKSMWFTNYNTTSFQTYLIRCGPEIEWRHSTAAS